ncbi:MAG: class I SAM-dependent methyltransferase [Pseudomonadota bacterium]
MAELALRDPKPPASTSVGPAVIVPVLADSPRGAEGWSGGVFGPNLAPVKNLSLTTLRKRFVADKDALYEAKAPAHSLAGTWLFGGIASAQFGHNVTRGMGTLWALDALPLATGIVHADLFTGQRLNPALGALADAFGLENRMRVAIRATAIEQLIIAPDLFSEATEARADPHFVDWVRRRRPDPQGQGRKLYVTRSRLDPKLGRILCEDILESLLADVGYEVFVPEDHSLSDQLAAYLAADKIIAAEGSALHIIPFALRPGTALAIIQRRPELPLLIENQVTSFADGPVTKIDAIARLHWPRHRRDNISLAEIDFHRLRAALIASGHLASDAPWRTPTEAETKASLRRGRPSETFLSDTERRGFLRALRSDRKAKSMAETVLEPGEVPAINGMPYIRMLRRLHAILEPNWYLEIGSFSGRSLELARCNFVAVDPSFRLRRPIMPASATEAHFIQKTSDAFFNSGFVARNGIQFDFAFLDGLHEFETLLRDFIGAEKMMAPGGVIALHDCCPTTEEMATREFHEGDWTGDVWKTLLILKEARPDLTIEVAKAAPTGLVLISDLDPSSKRLEERYEAMVAAYAGRELAGYQEGIAGFYQEIDLVDPKSVLQRVEAIRNL